MSVDPNMPTRFKSRNLHQRLRHAQLKHAASAIEPSITFMVTVLAAVFVWLDGSEYSMPQWSWIAVLLLGMGAVSVLIATGMSDPESVAQSITFVLDDYFHVESINDASIRSQLSQAAAYRARLQEVLHRCGGEMRGEVSNSLASVDDWLTGMGHLAHLLVPYRSEARRQSETKLHLRDRIAELEHRIGEATDARIKAQLRETIAGRRHQQRAIEELENLVERGLLRLERAVSALGTMNAQLSVLAARGDQEVSAARLTHDVNAEIGEIDAILHALDRVQSADLISLDVAEQEYGQ
jgi:hypothetical protein